MTDEQKFTLEEVRGALTSQEATDAAYSVLRDPARKSKPGWALSLEIIEAAIEAGFGS